MTRSELRRFVYERDHGLCRICGRPVAWTALEVDHIRPVHAGGQWRADNLRASCRPCNQARKGRWRRWSIRLGRELVRPTVGMVSMALDPATAQRLALLQARHELGRQDIIRLAPRALAQWEGVEPAESHTSP